jgi:H+/Cl- antiporter ClcA
VSSPGTTPGGPAGLSRFWLPALLLLGIVAGLLGPALTRSWPRPLRRTVLTTP